MDSSIKTLGSIIRKVRKEQGLTQQQLASVCGVGVRFLREVERGKETSQIGLVIRVVSMLGLQIKIGDVQL